MADETFKIDKNYKGVVGGITNDANKYISAFRVDPVTLRLLVENSALDYTLDSVSVPEGTITVSSGTVRISGGSIQLTGTSNVSVGSLPTIIVSDGTISSGTVNIGTSVNNWNIPAYDYIHLEYTGGDITQVLYKSGGTPGTSVGTLTLGYSGGTLTSITLDT